MGRRAAMRRVCSTTRVPRYKRRSNCQERTARTRTARPNFTEVLLLKFILISFPMLHLPLARMLAEPAGSSLWVTLLGGPSAAKPVFAPILRFYRIASWLEEVATDAPALLMQSSVWKIIYDPGSLRNPGRRTGTDWCTLVGWRVVWAGELRMFPLPCVIIAVP